MKYRASQNYDINEQNTQNDLFSQNDELNETHDMYKDLIEKIKSIDINKMTPMQAMATLHEIIETQEQYKAIFSYRSNGGL